LRGCRNNMARDLNVSVSPHHPGQTFARRAGLPMPLL
jgi:hypothetical protein